MKNAKPALASLAALLLCALVLPGAQAFKPTAEFGHVGIVRDALARISVPPPAGGTPYRFSERAILEVRDSTAGVDEIVSSRGELSVPTAHCDDELLPECSQRIIDIKAAVVALLATSSPDGEGARREVGRALHTLQDFFSHSNWINISGGQPGLGTTVLSRLGPTQDTCERGFSSLGSGTLAAFGLTNTTSGYFSVVFAPPEGKCNHGLLLDPGIHKDEPSRTGHAAARARAVDATESLIRQILAAPGVAGNDKAIRAFLDVRGAIGFVVDDTGSMGGVIAGVKSAIGSIVNAVSGSPSQPDRYILVNFNDPAVSSAFVTTDASALLARANGLFASGGGDCPELSMTGTLRAVNAAPGGSQLYVFTDASAKDASLFGNVITQATAKNINITFITFGSCSPIDPAYFAIASQTGGQLFALAQTTSETEKIFGLVTPYVSGSPKPLLAAKGAVGGARSFTFPVDSTLRSLQVSVAVDSGATSRLFDPLGREIVAGMAGVTVTPLTGGKLIAVTAPAVGNWRLALDGIGNFDISLSGDSLLELNRFEFVETRGRDGHAGLFPIKSQPLAGATQQARATVLGAFNTAQFSLINEAGAVIASLPATRGSGEANNDEFFASFVLPTQPFRVMVNGQLPAGGAYQRIYSPVFLGRSVKVEAQGGGYGAFSPGQTFSVRFLVTNLGASDTFVVTATDERGFITSYPRSLVLGAGGSAVVELGLAIPGSTPIGTTNNISLAVKGASSANGTVFTQIVRAATIAGDIDGDGDVDRDDVSIVFTARNMAASGNGDPRDVDHDGKITVLDARKLTLSCTRPNCARE
jgi:von Willebrand factor A domain-containing protein 7